MLNYPKSGHGVPPVQVPGRAMGRDAEYMVLWQDHSLSFFRRTRWPTDEGAASPGAKVVRLGRQELPLQRCDEEWKPRADVEPLRLLGFPVILGVYIHLPSCYLTVRWKITMLLIGKPR